MHVDSETDTANRLTDLALRPRRVQGNIDSKSFCCFHFQHTSTGPLRQRKSSHSQFSKQKHSRSPIRKSKIPTLVVCNHNEIALRNSIAHLRTSLAPLICIRTGLPHPEFPSSILQYHLLTHEQLDSLARWYHQTADAGNERLMYPAPIAETKLWTFASSRARSFMASTGHTVDLEAKRRRWGRFIGLRGCESPVNYDAMDIDEAEEEGLVERMEKEWNEALRRAEEETLAQEKAWRGRF